MKTAILFLLAAGIAPLLAQAEPELHTWIARDGRAIQATFLAVVRLNGEVLVIEKDGRQFSVPFAKLALESAALAKKLGKGEKTPPEQEADAPEQAAIKAKMNRIIFPRLQFVDASLDEVIDFLRIKSRDLDIAETDPAQKGVNIILSNPENLPITTLSFDLTNVPMSEVLCYIIELANMTYKVDRHAVQIGPLAIIKHELYQRIFRVPPDFFADSRSGDHFTEADPFAPAPAEAGGALPPRKTVIDILREKGIAFGRGAFAFRHGTFAVYDKTASLLLVRNTKVMLDRLEFYGADPHIEDDGTHKEPESGQAK